MDFIATLVHVMLLYPPVPEWKNGITVCVALSTMVLHSYICYSYHQNYTAILSFIYN